MTAAELGDAPPQELEAGDGQEPDDRQRAERLELLVPVRVTFVRRARRNGHGEDRHHVAQHVEH